MNQKEKVAYMLSEPVPHLVCQMAVPTVISMLVTSFYNMVDTFFVGKINTQATAAVGVVFSVMALIQACGFSLDMAPEILFRVSWERENLRKQIRWLLQAFIHPFWREFF